MKISDLGNISKDDVLDILGLQRVSTSSEQWLERASSFGVGLLVGAGVSLLLAPKSGQELRKDLGDRIRGVRCEHEEESTTKKSNEPFSSQSDYSK
jgi:hypothetical protein